MAFQADLKVGVLERAAANARDEKKCFIKLKKKVLFCLHTFHFSEILPRKYYFELFQYSFLSLSCKKCLVFDNFSLEYFVKKKLVG